MTVYAITDTKKGRTGIAPTYLQTTQIVIRTESTCRSGSSPKVDHFSRSSFAGLPSLIDVRLRIRQLGLLCSQIEIQNDHI